MLFWILVVGASVQKGWGKCWTFLVIVERPDNGTDGIEHVGIAAPGTEESIASNLSGIIRNGLELHP
jgi:hypothetical protein